MRFGGANYRPPKAIITLKFRLKLSAIIGRFIATLCVIHGFNAHIKTH
jgi:hypothetical protein